MVVSYSIESSVSTKYPYVLSAKKGAEIIGPYNGKRCKTGFTEIIIFSRIASLGLFSFFKDNKSIRCGNHRYEPDFVYIDKKNGIYLDIEIDEPYTISGHPTHYMMSGEKNVDSERNERITSAGWTVIRFSEEQFFCQTASCMKLIFQILKELGSIDQIPSRLLTAEDVRVADRWDYSQSNNLLNTRYRKIYLGADPAKVDLSHILWCVRMSLPIIKQSFKHKEIRKSFIKDIKSWLKYITR